MRPPISTQTTLNQRPYTAYGGAVQMWRCRRDEILIEGPAGTGKTRAVLEKIHFCLMKYPGTRALITRKTRASMTESVLVTYEEKVLPAFSPIKGDPGPTREHRKHYDYPNGSTLVVAGMDNPDRIMSTEYDIVACFEWTEANEDDHEKLTTRLRNGIMPYQQLIADCNPSFPKHWLNQRALANKMERILSRHEDNPSVTKAYLAKLDNLSGARRLRLRDGKWAAQDGLVYANFDARIHVLDRFEIPADWRRFRAIDFGYTNPFVCQWWALDGDNRMYLYREMYMSHRTIKEHGPKIKELSAGESIVATIADPEDAQARAELAQMGIPTASADKAIKIGIQDVTERLKVAGDDRPRLFVLRDSLVEIDERLAEAKKPLYTLAEFDNYHWPKTANGNEKEEPVKEDDHGMDTLRYAVRWANSGAVGGSLFR